MRKRSRTTAPPQPPPSSSTNNARDEQQQLDWEAILQAIVLDEFEGADGDEPYDEQRRARYIIYPDPIMAPDAAPIAGDVDGSNVVLIHPAQYRLLIQTHNRVLAYHTKAATIEFDPLGCKVARITCTAQLEFFRLHENDLYAECVIVFRDYGTKKD